MRKWTVLGFVASLFVLGSCCKQHSCECSNNSNEIVEVHTEKTKKKKAQGWCDDWDRYYKQLNQGSCKLK